jgi:hypothetical protein
VLDVLGDIESDLSAFHRVDDMWSMDVARFWLLAPRLPAYAGAVAARMNAQRQEGTAPPMAARPAPTPVSSARPGVRVVGATAAELGMSDIGDMFSFGVSGG